LLFSRPDFAASSAQNAHHGDILALNLRLQAHQPVLNLLRLRR
jgi:hypothetical protein